MDALVPQFSSLTIEQITEAFAKQVVSTAKVNITAVIRENLPMWETKLFPVIGAFEISKYEVLADILIEAGCRSAQMSEKERMLFVESVGVAVRRIRAGRGELTAAQKRAAQRSALASKASPVPSLGITSPVVMTKGVVPPSSAVGVKGQGGSSGSVVVSKPMAVQRVAVAVPPASGVVYDLDEFPFKEHSTRLNTEVNAFYAGQGGEWTPADDELMAVFTQISLSRFTPMQRLAQSFSSNETIKQGCFNAFKIKCKNLGVDLSKHGFQ
ncbi:hypothetical protein [Serratia marcescens]|uniref:hypothetical protein n=1 Tax=Serratia marcescens TaxID=615 RepID=UPI001F1517AA|nr:hypothetical protein [Serratia marcescens]